MILNNKAEMRSVLGMKHGLSPLAFARVFISVFVLVLGVSAASAACVAEYKAKRDNPTEFRHATMSVPDDKCSVGAAEAYVRSQLAASGWKLLAIVRVSG